MPGRGRLRRPSTRPTHLVPVQASRPSPLPPLPQGSRASPLPLCLPPAPLQFYWQENGQDVSIVNAVAAIDNCLREPIGRGQCSNIRGELE